MESEEAKTVNEGPLKNKKSWVISLAIACILFAAMVLGFLGGIKYGMFSQMGIIAGVLFLMGYILSVVIHFTKLRRFQKSYAITCFILLDLLLFFLVFCFFVPDDDKWRTYIFESELAAIEAKRAVPDNENAAILYLSLMSALDLKAEKQAFFGDGFISPANKLWKNQQYPETEEWLANHADTLNSLIKICQMEKCRFPIQWDPFERLKPDFLNRIEKMIFLSNVILSAANRDIGQGDVESGIKKYLLSLQMAKHCYQQPSILDFCLGFSLEQKTLSLIYKAIVQQNIGDEQLQLIRDAVTIQDNWSKDWSAILEARKLEEKNICCAVYEMNARGKVRFNRNVMHYLDSKRTSYFQRYFRNRFLSMVIPLFVPYAPETVGGIIDKAYENYNIIGYPDLEIKKLIGYERIKLMEFEKLKSLKMLMSWLSIDALQIINMHNSYICTLAKRRACSILLGLRFYKNKNDKWPDNLEAINSLVPSEALLDPIAERGFIYKTTNEGFNLYSAGKNKIDENGINDCGYGNENGTDDVLIWPK